jgi:acyl-CoA reductase-like NAD-dependent aldehyde dehydrogenase
MAMDEDDINKLSRELKDFTTGLENFTKVINKNKSSSSSDSSGTPTTPVVDATTKKITVAFDKSTEKIVNSLGRLAAVLTSSSRSEAQKERYIKKFNESIQKVTATQEKELERAVIRADRQSRRDEILAKRAEGYQARAEARARASQAESDKRREEADKEYIEKSKEKFENLYNSFVNSFVNLNL